MGIKIFSGDDRVAAQARIDKELGTDREVFEGDKLTKDDLPSIFLGAMLFTVGKRKILVKDLSENKDAFEDFSAKIEDYLKTEADVILFETKIDKRLSSTKNLVKAGVKIEEFKKKEEVDMRAVFNIYDTALRNGKMAVKKLEEIESKQDPYMFFGLMVSQALKKLEWKPNGAKEKRALGKLSELDMLMKTTSIEPWVLVKGFLTQLSSL